MVGVKTRAALLAAPVVATPAQTIPASQTAEAAEIARLLKIIEELTARLNALKAMH